ncbi:MAG: ABC-2 transporter permease [Defluviitaleaceae bacterium]|nr:ABC-2 transporter permease [Defluviitaleaceae bacterium]MCL2274526.1 ABC-2 transporter permease [Defluviitaleaceae bacterium]
MIWKIFVLDWRAMQLISKVVILCCPLFLFLVGITHQLLVLPMSMWFALTIAVSTFQDEEKCSLEKLYHTLPVTRRQIVNARFLYSFVLMLIFIPISHGVTAITRLFASSRWYFGTEGNLTLIAFGVLAFAVFHLFMFPLLFKLGYQKGKMLGLYLPSGLFGGLYMLYLTLETAFRGNITFRFIVFASEYLWVVSAGVFTLAMGLLGLSYVLSQRLYARREL